MGSVTVGGQTFTIYGTLAGAQTFYLVEMGATKAKWDAADADGKAVALAKATRLLDRQKYVDEAATQTLRLGIALFETANYALAGMLMVDSTLDTQITSGSNVKRAKSGDDEVEFFEPTLYINGRFPINIMELIGDYLSSSDSGDDTSGSFASGTSDPCPDRSADPRRYGITQGG